jgi:hypothetical protein
MVVSKADSSVISRTEAMVGILCEGKEGLRRQKCGQAMALEQEQKQKRRAHDYGTI